MSSPPNKSKLIANTIRDAFAGTPYPGDSRLVYDTSGRHSECSQVAHDFKGKHWTDLSLTFLRQHPDSLFFLTPEAYRFYLPAYLVASALHYGRADIIPSNVVQSLTLPKKEADSVSFRVMAQGFDGKQREAIAAFLKFLQSEHGGDFPFEDPKVALEQYWASKD